MNDRPMVSNAISSRYLIGSAVHNSNGDSLGKVEAFLLNPKNGVVSSLVMSTGGVMGLAAKRVAVPWDMIVLNESDRSITIDVDQDFLNRLPPYGGEY